MTDTTTISLYSRDDATTYQAAFEAVRSARGYVLGWATVPAPDCTLRFPAIVYTASKNGWVATVSDWQAPWSGVDLSDPEDVAHMLKTGQGSFIAARTGNAVDCGRHFAAQPHTPGVTTAAEIKDLSPDEGMRKSADEYLAATTDEARQDALEWVCQWLEVSFHEDGKSDEEIAGMDLESAAREFIERRRTA